MQLCHASLKENIYQVKEELTITLKIKQEELPFCLSIQKQRTKCLHAGKACLFPKREGPARNAARLQRSPGWVAGWRFHILQHHLAQGNKIPPWTRVAEGHFLGLNVKFINNF